MGRAAREKWNRRLRQLAAEEAELRRAEQHAEEQSEDAPPFSPVSFWADWFRRNRRIGGPGVRSSSALRCRCLLH